MLLIIIGNFSDKKYKYSSRFHLCCCYMNDYYFCGFYPSVNSGKSFTNWVKLEGFMFKLWVIRSSLYIQWAPPSEFVSSSIPSWQTLTAHVQLFRGARDLAFFLKVPLDSLLVWASSGGSGETARMRRLAWTFAARIGDKYQIRLAGPKWHSKSRFFWCAKNHLNVSV